MVVVASLLRNPNCLSEVRGADIPDLATGIAFGIARERARVLAGAGDDPVPSADPPQTQSLRQPYRLAFDEEKPGGWWSWILSYPTADGRHEVAQGSCATETAARDQADAVMQILGRHEVREPRPPATPMPGRGRSTV